MPLPKLEAREPEFCIDTAALGRIDVLPLTIGHMDLIENIEEETSASFAGRLLVILGRKSDSSKLTDVDVETCSDTEINDFSETFLEHNQYLFRESVREESRDEKGNLIVSFSEGDILHHKEKDESHSDYLFRLFKIQQAEWKEQARRIMAPFEDMLKVNKRLFTPPFVKALTKSQSATAHLGNTIERLRIRTPSILDGAGGDSARDRPNAAEISPSQRSVLDLSAIRNPAHDTNEKLTDVVNRLDTMETLAFQMAEIVKRGSDTVSQFLVAFGAASEKADRSSRRAFRIAITAISVAILSPIVHIGYSEWHNQHAQTDTAAAIGIISNRIEMIAEMQRKNMEQTGAELNDSNIAVKESVERLSAVIQALTESLQPNSGSHITPHTDGTSAPSK